MIQQKASLHIDIGVRVHRFSQSVQFVHHRVAVYSASQATAKLCARLNRFVLHQQYTGSVSIILLFLNQHIYPQT